MHKAQPLSLMFDNSADYDPNKAKFRKRNKADSEILFGITLLGYDTGSEI